MVQGERLGGLFAKQRKAPVSSGTLATDSVSFGVLMTACIVVLTGLSYLAALSLGPVLERLVGGHSAARILQPQKPRGLRMHAEGKAAKGAT